MKKYLSSLALSIVLSAICHVGLAQKKPLRKIVWIIGQGIGPSGSVASYPNSYPTNNLMSQYAKSSLHFELISAQRYFGNWGAEVNLAVNFNQDDSDDLFKKAIGQLHPNEKFEQLRQQSSGDLVHSIGPVYKKEFRRFAVIAKGLVGVTSNKADSATATFLSADRSTLRNVLWAPDHHISYHFIFNPGISVMYRINSVFAVSLGVSYWQMSNRLTYTERTTDASDDRLISQKEYLYSSPIRQVRFGVGLNFTL